MRAFARDMGMSAPAMSRVLNEKQGLSETAANRISLKLGMSASERTYFLALVRSEHSRSYLGREAAKSELTLLKKRIDTLDADKFRAIADWFHFAILELVAVQSFKKDPAWIARALGINIIQARSALDRLLRLGLLKVKDGKLICTGANAANPDGRPSLAVRKFHSQILSRATRALTSQNVEEREFFNLVIALSERDLPVAKQMIQEFGEYFRKNVQKSNPKTRVYNLSLQFFALQEPRAKSETQVRSLP